MQVPLLARLKQHAFQTRAKLLLYQAIEILAMRLAAPVETEKRVEVHAGSDIFQANAFQHARPPERRLRDVRERSNAR